MLDFGGVREWSEWAGTPVFSKYSIFFYADLSMHFICEHQRNLREIKERYSNCNV